MTTTNIIAGGAPSPSLGATPPGGGGSSSSTITLGASDAPIKPGLVGQAVLFDAPSDTSFWGTAKADSANTASAKGIVTRIENPLAHQPTITAQYAGIVELTIAQWNAVGADSSGLTPGSAYYLSDATTGAITTTATVTSNHFVVYLGTAISATKMLLGIVPPVENP